MNRFIAAGLAGGLAVSASAMSAAASPGAAKISDCREANVGIGDIVTPAGENSRTFYNGAVTVYVVDHGEPACCSWGLAIVMPGPEDEGPQAPICTAVMQLTPVDLAKTKSAYDPNRGLLLSVPTKKYDPERGHLPGGPVLKLRINLKEGSVKEE